MDVRWRGSRAVRKHGVLVVRLSRDLAVSVFGLVRSGVSADVRHDNVYATCCLHLSARCIYACDDGGDGVFIV